jgi:hypothetical protein
MRRMELQPGDASGGGASSAAKVGRMGSLAISRTAICGMIATSNGRVGEYVGTGLTAPSRSCPRQQE